MIAQKEEVREIFGFRHSIAQRYSSSVVLAVEALAVLHSNVAL